MKQNESNRNFPGNILTTKLFIPLPRADLVSRPRLVSMLNQGLDQKLILISAPAGFGKTTLLSEWISQNELPCCWLSLDQKDTDLPQFMAYIIAALHSIQIEMDDQVLNSPLPQQIEDSTSLLVPLINQIATTGKDFCLVLDDYHQIQNEDIHEAITYILDHLPIQMHLVITTRSDPPLRLAQLRARGSLCEIRTADLRFTIDEAIHFLSQSMGIDLSLPDFTSLAKKTEGWIAGLQMAAISLQKKQDKHSFVTTFAGNDRYIGDFLLDEVLNHQPEPIRSFLLQTSILDQLCAPLCDFVTGRNDSREMLVEFERTNLFLIPLDHHRRWYRYHHLFADLLRIRLKQIRDAPVLELYRRASSWYEKEQMPSEAVKLAILGEDARQVSQIVEGHLLAVASTSELSLLNRLLASLPEETVNSNPWLTLALAWGKAYLGDMDSIEPLLERAALSLHGLDDVTQNRISARILILRSYATGSRRDYHTSIQLAREALGLLPSDDLSMRSFALLVVGNAYRFDGNLRQALELHSQAFLQSEAAKDTFLSVMILSRLIDIYRTIGQLNRAHQTGMQALEIIEDYQKQTGGQSFILGYLKLRMCSIHYERNEIELALQCAQVGLDLARQWGAYDSISLGYFHLAKIHKALGNVAQALSYLQEFKKSYPSEHRMQYRFASAIEAEINLQSGNLQEASEWTQSCGVSSSNTIHFLDLQFSDVFAQVLMAQNRLAESQRLLERLLKAAQKFGAVEYEIQFLGRIALVLQKLGNEEASNGMLTRALALAETEGYLRTFLDQGEPMAQLLYRAASQGIYPEFCNRLLTVFSSSGKLTAIRQDNLIEPLSAREIEVLTYIAGGNTNQEIAQALHLSLFTVKSHARNIFAKLDVKSRTEAVARARLLGVFPKEVI